MSHNSSSIKIEVYRNGKTLARGGAILPVRVGLEVELYYQRGWG